jgi:Flp pilus assembly protein TadG
MSEAAGRKMASVVFGTTWACFGSERGAAAVYVALVLPVFVGAGALAVDVASWYSAKRTVQTGVDAAAYAAALDLARQGPRSGARSGLAAGGRGRRRRP